MSANCSSVWSRPCALIESWKVVSLGDGGAPSTPAATCTFCSRIARTTSVAVSWRDGQAVGIEPHPHAVLAGAEDLHAADAADAGQLVLHPQVGVVREVEHVVALVRRDEVDDHHQVGRGLLGRHADALHFRRQPRQRLRDAVLHLDLRVVEIAAERERHRQRHRAVGGRLREHVEHALDAVDLLLERRRDGLGDDLRIGAGIGGADDDRRRHDARVFADRQLEDAPAPPPTRISSERTAAKIGRSMKNRENFMASSLPAAGRRGRAGRTGARLARPSARRPDRLTAPGRTRCRPLTTTRSPSATPDADDPQAVDERPELHRAVLDRLVRGHDEDEALVEIGADGAVLDQQAVQRRRSAAAAAARTGRASACRRRSGRWRGRGWCRSRDRSGCRGS